MNLRGEINKPKGYFSSYNLNQEHKQRLENFIYRHKAESPEDNRAKSRSPVTCLKPKPCESQSKEKYLADKESALNKKEIELKKKEKLLNQLSGRIITKDLVTPQVRPPKQPSRTPSDNSPQTKPALTFSEVHSSKQNFLKRSKQSRPPSSEDFRLSASPIAKREKLLTSKVKLNQIETLISSEAEIDQIRLKLSSKISKTESKYKNLEKSSKDLNEALKSQSCRLIKSLCREIVIGLIPNAVYESNCKSLALTDARANALQVSMHKMRRIEGKLKQTKESLQEESSKLLQNKNNLYEQSVKIQEKFENIEIISQNIGKSEKNLIQLSESFKKREELLNQKLIQINLLEKQIQDQELSLLLLSKKRSESADKAKIIENPFAARESAVKAKENELNLKKKDLEEKKNQIDEFKSKIKWRLNNIVSMERRTEKLKQIAETKFDDFESFVKNEEKILNLWRDRVKRKEAEVNQLKVRSKDLEKRVSNFTETKEGDKDSIDEFQVLENHSKKSSKVEKFTDFAKMFQIRQAERRKEYQEISKEKKELSEKISSMMKFQ